MSLMSYVFCKNCTKSDTKRDAGLEIPSTVEYIRNIPYGENKKYHILDVCFPKEADGQPRDAKKDKIPVIVSVHGGGFVYGSKEVYQFYAASLAERGFAVINFNYRLAPKYKFPSPVEDLNAVLSWLLDHKGEYPFDTKNVFLIGDSAGAQIGCQYGVLYSNENYAKIMGIEKPEITIRALSFACGTYNLKKRILAEGNKGLMRDYVTKNPTKFGEKLDILEYITKEYPPTYLFSSQSDFLLEECGIMAEFLKEKGVTCEHKIYGNEQTYHVFHVDMRNEFSSEANDDQTTFFKRFLV